MGLNFLACMLSCLVVSDSLWQHGPTRLCCPWNFPGKNTGVGCHFLLQGIFLTQGSNSHLLHLLHWQADSLPLLPPGKPTFLGGGLMPSSMPTVAMRILRDGAWLLDLTDGSWVPRPRPRIPMQSVAEAQAVWWKMVVKALYKSTLFFFFCSSNAKIWQERGHFHWFLAHSEILEVSGEAVVGKFTAQLCWPSKFRWESKYIIGSWVFSFFAGEQTSYERGSENSSKYVHDDVLTFWEKRLLGKKQSSRFQNFLFAFPGLLLPETKKQVEKQWFKHNSGRYKSILVQFFCIMSGIFGDINSLFTTLYK